MEGEAIVQEPITDEVSKNAGDNVVSTTQEVSSTSKYILQIH